MLRNISTVYTKNNITLQTECRVSVKAIGTHSNYDALKSKVLIDMNIH
jgi:hypothetical protein